MPRHQGGRAARCGGTAQRLRRKLPRLIIGILSYDCACDGGERLRSMPRPFMPPHKQGPNVLLGEANRDQMSYWLQDHAGDASTRPFMLPHTPSLDGIDRTCSRQMGSTCVCLLGVPNTTKCVSERCLLWLRSGGGVRPSRAALDVQNRTAGPYLVAVHRILIQVMSPGGGGARVEQLPDEHDCRRGVAVPSGGRVAETAADAGSQQPRACLVGRQQDEVGAQAGLSAERPSPIGYTWSYSAGRIGWLVPIWQPCIESSFQ
jgi:hypothetical protein